MPVSSSDDLARTEAAFAAWRARQSGRRRLPAELWAAAVSLLDRYPLSLVARRLRLNAAQLRRRQRAASGLLPARRPEGPHFVSVPEADLVCGLAATVSSEGVLRLVIERADGGRLTLGLPASQWARLEALCLAWTRP